MSDVLPHSIALSTRSEVERGVPLGIASALGEPSADPLGEGRLVYLAGSDSFDHPNGFVTFLLVPRWRNPRIAVPFGELDGTQEADPLVPVGQCA